MSDEAKTRSERRKARRMRGHQKDLGRTEGSDQGNRELLLDGIGFSSYNDYLSSDLWKGIVDKVLRVKGRSCSSCGDTASGAVQKRFRKVDLLGDSLKYIVPTCPSCMVSGRSSMGIGAIRKRALEGSTKPLPDEDVGMWERGNASKKGDPFVMRFGKFKGKSIKEVPTSYLCWAIRELTSLNRESRVAFEREVDLRAGKAISAATGKPAKKRSEELAARRDPDRKPVSYGTPVSEQEPFPWALEEDAGCPFEPGSHHPGFAQMSTKDIEVIRGVLGEEWMREAV